MPNEINGGRPLRFPIDHSPFHRSKVKFQAVKVNPPGLNITLASGQLSQGRNAVSTAARTGATIGANTVKGDALAKDKEQGFRKLKYQPISGEVANIHLPMSFAVNDNFEYSGAEFRNSLTIAGAAAFEAGNDAVASMQRAISDTQKSFVDFFAGQKSLTGTSATLSALRAGELFSAIGASGLANTLSVVGKVALHPNIRNRFTGVSLRSFTFAFKFVPKSRRESEEVKKIVKFFRFHAYPNQIPPDTSFGVGYEYPSLFKIQLLSGTGGNFEHVGTPIKYSYLRSISTNYNPTTPVLHDDGSPTEVDLSLTFTEHKTLHRGDIMKEDKLGEGGFYDEGGDVSDAMNTGFVDRKKERKLPHTNTRTSSVRQLPADASRSGGGPF